MSFGGINTFQQYSTDFGLGHNGVKISLNYFDGIPEPALLNSLASNDLKLIFKSLLKRDETTKEKALSDLLNLLDDFPDKEYLFDDDIFSLCWSQVYAKMLVSESKAIRLQSHQVTTKLIKALNKRISKFLKDFIPLVLMGTCDTDSSVSKACVTFLNDSFNNDSKKTHSLWTVFHADILDLVKELIVVENEETISDEKYIGKEDSQFRYNRLMTSAVYLLTNLLKLNKSNLSQLKSTYKTILNAESLWKLLSLKNTQNIKAYEALLQLIQTLYHIGYLTTHKDVLKLSTKRLLKSTSHVNSKNLLKISPIVPAILDTLTMLDAYKDGRIWSYDNSYKEKILRLLSVSCTSPNPGFFVSMYEFYKKTSNNELLDYALEWSPLWRKAVKSLNERSFLGRFGAELLGECWTNYLKFFNEHPEQNMKDAIQSDILNTIESGRSLSRLPALKEALRDSLPPSILVGEIEKRLKSENTSSKTPDYVLENLTLLLCIGSENEDALNDLTKIMFHIISPTHDGVAQKNTHVVKVYRYFINSNLESLSKEISQLIYELPTWVDEATYEELSMIIVDYTNSVFVKEGTDYLPSLEDFFTAALSCNVPNKQIATTLNQMNSGAYRLLESSSHIREFVTEYIESYNFNDEGEIFKGHLITSDNIIQLYESSLTKNKLETFCHFLPDLDIGIREVLIENSSFLQASLFSGSKEVTENIYELTSPFLNCNISITKSFVHAIIDHAKRKTSYDNCLLYLEYAVKLISCNAATLNIFLPSDIEATYSSNVPFIDYRIALVNNLELNTHLLQISVKEMNMSSIEQFIKYGLFLDAIFCRLPDILNDRGAIFLTMISELAGDYNYLSPEPKENLYDFNNTLFKRESYKFSSSEIIEEMTKTIPTTAEKLSVISTLLDASSPTVTFYKYRILHKILLNEVDSISNSFFTRVAPSIEAYISSVVRSKENSEQNYLKAAILLSAFEKFDDHETFIKLRKFLASECIGNIKKDSIQKTSKSIILLDNLLTSNKNSDLPIPVAPQRLNMILNSISEWLDSEFAYEPDFAIMRLSLLKFFRLLLRFPSVTNTGTKLFDISVRLLTDSLSMCQLEEASYLLELRLYCLKLFQEMSKFDRNLWSDDNGHELSASLIDLCFEDFPSEANNQISAVFYRTLHNVLTTFKTSDLLAYYDNFFDAFLSKTSNENFNRLRLLASILEKLIYEKQQDAVIEYELMKQQKGHANEEELDDDEAEEDTSAENAFKFPAGLISKLSTDIPQEYLENENEYTFIKYLWYWDLSFCFFHNVSYNLRQFFIDQLKSKNLIIKLFDFIADQIDLQESKFWLDAGSDAILNYNVVKDDFSPYREDIYVEAKKLLGHSMYKLFDNVGSLTSSWWLNIKDRTLQSNIEKFVSQFISPILIKQELEDVFSKMDSLTSKDDALTIKINKVTNEVKASYLIDEQKLELSFRLPSNYPLTNVQVIGVSRVGISEQKWKQWIMSTQRVITGMNGSVMDSLELFTKNVNLQFSGFEECAICYSILHAVDRKLPTKTCPTCNNKFHGACLYKWFRSSGNNTCPLCRSEIPFRK